MHAARLTHMPRAPLAAAHTQQHTRNTCNIFSSSFGHPGSQPGYHSHFAALSADHLASIVEWQQAQLAPHMGAPSNDGVLHEQGEMEDVAGAFRQFSPCVRRIEPRRYKGDLGYSMELRSSFLDVNLEVNPNPNLCELEFPVHCAKPLG